MKTYFDTLTLARNASIHSVLPSFQHYELEKAAYLSLKVLDVLYKGNAFPVDYRQENENDEKFLKSFQESKVKEVQKKLEDAKAKAKTLAGERKTIPIEPLIAQDPFLYWLRLIIPCPICSNDAVLEGYSDVVKAEATDYSPEEDVLAFFPDRFQCEWCKLRLEDYEELRNAGISNIYDRDDDIESFRDYMKQLAEDEGWDEKVA